MGEINRLDHRGHGPMATWSPNNKVEIKTAEEVFNKLRLPVAKGGEGNELYDISDPQNPGIHMKTFDPAATEILAVPLGKMVGG